MTLNSQCPKAGMLCRTCRRCTKAIAPASIINLYSPVKILLILIHSSLFPHSNRDIINQSQYTPTHMSRTQTFTHYPEGEKIYAGSVHDK